MTTKDKTAEQLVASIRKSKDDATVPKPSTTTRRSPTPRTRRKPATPRAPKAEPGDGQGTYPFGRRVWPD